MKKPSISFGKIAYVTTPAPVLDALVGEYGANADKEVRVNSITLEDLELDSADITQWVKSVLEETEDCEIIFHI